MEGLEDYMLECTNKKIFGVECLGCGIQRAAAFLFRGEFIAAFKMYPAIYTLLLLALFVIFNFFVKFKYAFQIKVGLLFLNVAIIIVSYIIKMSKVL
ncbi:uncharacterized protein DUF2752 [Ulvibacter sp. MAR_2010_11]|nr:DUF2752 domain-containing protein [Ulvibacter sp. MAR_2010_11]PKA84317.1 uncharacterized protein DUF2752 [Ulvibacter sp. MAR_2010_11]